MTRAYGNLMNRIMEDTAGKPEVGMGATEIMWSDRHAGTISRIISPKSIAWKQDRATGHGDGRTEPRTYTYERDDDCPETIFTQRKNGRWVRKGESLDTGSGLLIGIRNEYYDPSF